MSKKFEIILGYVDKPVAVGGAAASLTDQYNTDKSGFSLVNQTAQTGATVASVISIVKLTAGFTPFLNIKANTLAATTVFLKITAEYKTNQKFDNGDVLSLIGNVAGIVASITLLAGASGPALVFTGVGVTATAAGIVTSDAVKNLYQSLILPVVEKHFATNTNAAYLDYWVAPDLALVSLAKISASYTSQIAVSRWDPDSHEVGLGRDDTYPYGITAGGGGYFEPGGDGGVMIFPLPEYPGWSIDIGPIQVIAPGGGGAGLDRYH